MGLKIYGSSLLSIISVIYLDIYDFSNSKVHEKPLALMARAIVLAVICKTTNLDVEFPRILKIELRFRLQLLSLLWASSQIRAYFNPRNLVFSYISIS